MPTAPTAPSPAPSTAPSGPPKLVNLYYARTTGTAKSCIVCSKETVTCLANEGVTDWMHVCKSHLLDPGFAKPAPSTTTTTPTSTPPASPAPTPSPVPQSEIDKVKKEYEEKQKRKTEAAEKAKSDSSTPAASPASTSTVGKAFSALRTSASAITSLASTTQSTLFPPAPPPQLSATELARAEAAKAKVFVLNRDYFRMRQDAKRREWEKKDAIERAKGWSFPKVPTGGFPSMPTGKIG
ncbi:hypothetical protein JCM5296_001987 [Sporobolomyces johnsonii]